MPAARLFSAAAVGAVLVLTACTSAGRTGGEAAPGRARAGAATATAMPDTVLTPARLVGTWRYTLDTPGGGSGGYYVFRASGDSLVGDVRRALPGEPGGEAPPREMRAIAIDGAAVTFAYEAGSYGALAASLRRLSADSLSGRLYVGESDLPLTVVRVR